MLATSSTAPALRPLPALHPFHRFIAAGAAALLLLLTILAVSPQLHAGFHAHDATTESVQTDDGCVISLFAGGVTATPAALGLALPPPTFVIPAPTARAEIFVSPPRYLLRPERGPPRR